MTQSSVLSPQHFVDHTSLCRELADAIGATLPLIMTSTNVHKLCLEQLFALRDRKLPAAIAHGLTRRPAYELLGALKAVRCVWGPGKDPRIDRLFALSAQLANELENTRVPADPAPVVFTSPPSELPPTDPAAWSRRPNGSI